MATFEGRLVPSQQKYGISLIRFKGTLSGHSGVGYVSSYYWAGRWYGYTEDREVNMSFEPGTIKQLSIEEKT